jgi:hypothetical protein
MKRLAVLIYGQPRFINYTWKFIKEEYTIPDIETYYFAHMWEDISYVPNCPIEDYEKLDLTKDLEKDITVLKLDNYDILYDVVRDYHPKIKKVKSGKHKPVRPEQMEPLSYRYGQYVSKQEAYKLLKEYEKVHNIKFDIVVTQKTDFVFKNKECYETEKEYIQEKINLYADVEFSSNLIKNTTAYYREFKDYKTVKTKYNLPRGEKIQVKWIGPFDRLTISDHWALYSRDVAHIFCEQWFDTTLKIFEEIRDLDVDIPVAEKFKKLWRTAGIGELLIRNKVNLIGINSRYTRVVNTENCKDKFIAKISSIYCKLQDIKTEHQNIQNQLIKLFPPGYVQKPPKRVDATINDKMIITSS